MNKKSYNYTERQRRKDKSIKRIGMWNAPKDYVRDFNITFRRQCKAITEYNLVNEDDRPYPINGRHTAAWHYW